MALDFNISADHANKKVELQIRAIKTLSREAIRKGFYFIGRELREEAKRSIINGPKSGRLYRIKGRKNLHRASAPGESPANLFGNLQKSIGYIVKGSDSMEFGAGGESGKLHGLARKDVKYARRLELGGGSVAQRPYLSKAIDAKEKQVSTIFENELKRSLNKPA